MPKYAGRIKLLDEIDEEPHRGPEESKPNITLTFDGLTFGDDPKEYEAAQAEFEEWVSA